MVVVVTVILASFSIVENKDVVHTDDDRQVGCKGITEEDEKEMQNIVMLFDDTNVLKDYLNQEVLKSPDRLVEEISMVERLLCFELEGYEYLVDEKVKIYLLMLDYYDEIFKDEDEVIVDTLTFDDSAGFFSVSLEVVLQDKRHLKVNSYYDYSDYVNYSPGGWDEREEVLEDMEDPMHILKTDVIGQLYLFFLNPLQETFEEGIPSYFADKNDLDWEMEIDDISFQLLDFKMFVAEGDLELRSNLENEKRWRKLVLFPKASTFDILDRWEELHEFNSKIPFPKHLIDEEKWVSVARYFVEHQDEMDDIDAGIYNYIRRDSAEGRFVEDIANGIE